MPGRMQLLLPALLATLSFHSASAEPPPIKDFARLPGIRNVAISPDGQRLLYIGSMGDQDVVVTLPSAADAPPKAVTASEPGEFDIRWCGWANNERILCGVSATARDSGLLYGISRLVAINADGSRLKVLLQNSDMGSAQFQDQILDWTPAEPDTVLIEEKFLLQHLGAGTKSATTGP